MNKLTLLLATISLFSLGCDADESSQTTLQLDFAGLEPLGSGFVYEGWLITSEGPVSTGRFALAESGSAPESVVDAEQLNDASAFVLTIEPESGDDPAPSATHVLAGSINGNTADLSIADGAALGSDFAASAGTFVLATPSSASTTDNNQGIWFLSLPMPPSASLSLPTLPDGWIYEGWIVSSEGPISTGRFGAVDQADADGAGPDGGPDGGPPFPGQDFIDPALDLVGLTAVISVEPEPDDSAAPFALKPLVATIGSELEPTSQTMSNNAAASAPSGLATFSQN